eukprot:2676053-Pleurochrysis_carterae.AAC.3
MIHEAMYEPTLRRAPLCISEEVNNAVRQNEGAAGLRPQLPLRYAAPSVQARHTCTISKQLDLTNIATPSDDPALRFRAKMLSKPAAPICGRQSVCIQMASISCMQTTSASSADTSASRRGIRHEACVSAASQYECTEPGSSQCRRKASASRLSERQERHDVWLTSRRVKRKGGRGAEWEGRAR